MPAVDCSLDDIYHMFLSDGLVQGDERASRRSVVLYSSHGDGLTILSDAFRALAPLLLSTRSLKELAYNGRM